MPGGSCNSLGSTVLENGFRYTCIKAPKSVGNLFGKKMIWDAGVKVELESLTNSADILSALNTLGYGYWTLSTKNLGYKGKTYISNYNCYVYMSPNKQDMINYWNWAVNTMFYRGSWVGLKTQLWIVNDISDDGACIKYFAYKYGGQIYSQ